MRKEIVAWAERAKFASQENSGYGGHVVMLNDFVSVREFVMQYVDDTGSFPKDFHAVPKLKKYAFQGEFRVQFPGD